jgi:hypothetical protein
MPSYQTNDPKGWCGDPKRGAALGRPTIQDAPRDVAVKLTLRCIRLNSGGYDSNGTYFGIGNKLYWYANEDGTIDAMIRAYDRHQAKLFIQTVYPRAKFFR